MRMTVMLLCLSLTGCAGMPLPGGQPSPETSPASVAPPANPAGRGASSPGRPAAGDPDRLQDARAYCWAKVEEQKGLRDIDRRIAFIDKCIAEELKQNR